MPCGNLWLAKPNHHALHDLGQAAANLSLQATALGLQAHQMAGIVPEKARETYNVPEGFEVVTGIAVGYPGNADSLPDGLKAAEAAERSRRPLAETVFKAAWGQAAGI